jgi:hypothetical protein
MAVDFDASENNPPLLRTQIRNAATSRPACEMAESAARNDESSFAEAPAAGEAKTRSEDR